MLHFMFCHEQTDLVTSSWMLLPSKPAQCNQKGVLLCFFITVTTNTIRSCYCIQLFQCSRAAINIIKKPAIFSFATRCATKIDFLLNKFIKCVCQSIHTSFNLYSLFVLFFQTLIFEIFQCFCSFLSYYQLSQFNCQDFKVIGSMICRRSSVTIQFLGLMV